MPTQTKSDPSPSTGLIQPELEFAIITPGQQEPAFTLTPGGIVIRDNLTFDEWRDGLKLFKWAQTSLKMGFAGYLAFGQRYGKDKVDSALGQLEFDMPTVTQAMDIMTVPEQMRHDNLVAEHYVILARSSDLTKAKKIHWAKVASEQNLTPPQLKASIHAGEVVTVAVARQQQHGIIGIHGIRAELDIWLNRVGGIEGILKMPAPHQQEILVEIEPIANLYTKIKDANLQTH